mmetsp:Transcript_17068/g.32139  ORF Transcript_17068/g.32139 Transcript_17068/m.32139 type:complete len:489 (+) Transcript_17068:121-1587(+)
MESKEESKGWYGDSAKDEKGGSGRVLLDDIHCLHWLEEIGMEQYYDTFRTNFTSGGDYLSRKRLAQVQIRHFPSMNITNFDHQKILFKHITKVLEQAFVDQTNIMAERKKKAKEAEKRRLAEEKLAADEKRKKEEGIVGVVKKTEAKASRRKKRYSFEDQAWDIINKSRGADSKGAYDHLKDAEEIQVDFLSKAKAKVNGKMRKPSVRRRSFEGGDLNNAHDKAMMFGNMAMEFDSLQSKMMQMQSQHLNNIKETIGCERVRMLFLNDKTRELMFCSDSKWFRVPAESGITGYAIVTGETLNIADVHEDYRYNGSVDMVTGGNTKSIVVHPIRGNRGGGRVIGVIEIANKHDEAGEPSTFTDVDEELLSSLTSQITDVLHLDFQELVNINDSLSAFATPILPHTVEKRRDSLKKSYEQGTVSSESISAHDKYKPHGAKKELIDSQFNMGRDSSEKERGRARVSRRKSFGEELNAEIAANPELLHVRKE